MSNRRFKIAFLKRLIVPILCSYLLFQVCSCFNSSPRLGKNETSEVGRKSKNLFPFVWVTFQPSPCGGSTTKTNDGFCVQRGKCSKRGGTASGNCQDSFGECCMVEAMCNENMTTIDVNQLVTTLNSPTPPETPCTFRFKKEPNICQIRLDFEDYESAQADEDGVCLTEKLRIKDSITVDNSFVTCGKLSKQHMYLTFGTQDMIEVSPILKLASSKYRIVATRIPCDSKNRAPDYCLQYFTKTEGVVKSFDFGGQQQDNQHYTICVKPMPTSEMVQWKPCGSAITTSKPFDIITIFNVPGAPCGSDWIQVKGRNTTCEPFTSITSKWKPYELMVNFDEMELPAPPPGFTIGYNSTADGPCTTACAEFTTPMYACDCNTPSTDTCLCIITTSPGAPVQADFNNTGFCLEYSQL